MLTTILLILADLALGAMALKLGKSNERVTASLQETTSALQQTQATMQLILANHDTRITVLEKAA